MSARHRIGIAVAAASMLAACSFVTGSRSPASSDRQGAFLLEFRATAPSYGENEPVDAVARLSYDGPDAVAALAGTGSGAILFNLEQLDGDVDQSASQHDDCRGYELPADEQIETAFRKNGAYDPAAAAAPFWREFFKEPELRLPVGRYRLTAFVPLSVGTGCPGQPLDLRASIEIDVVAK